MQYIFVSYAKPDIDLVRPVVEALRQELKSRSLDVEPWIDFTGLLPGQEWRSEIARVLQAAIGLLVFISPASIASDWVRGELETAEAGGRFILPVLLRRVPDLPPNLARIQYFDLTGLQESPSRAKSAISTAVRKLADSIERRLESPDRKPPVSTAEAPALASTLADDARGRPSAAPGSTPPDSVFVVHGHNDSALDVVAEYLTERGIKPVVLKRIGGPAQSLLQKFLAFSHEARFAIVLLSADDMGASLRQFKANGVGERALQFRARQNVILELGFFYGFLGWEKVFVLYSEPSDVYPNFERPSDLEGVLFDKIDDKGEWRALLNAKLLEAGFRFKSPRAAKKSQKSLAP